MSEHGGHHSSNHDERLSRLEAVVEGVASDLRSLANIVQTHVGSAGKTNWQTIFSGLAVIVAIVFAMNRATIAPMEESNRYLHRDLEHIVYTQQQMNDRYAQLENWKGVTKSATEENAHELDLVWGLMHDKMIPGHAELKTDVANVKSELDKRWPMILSNDEILQRVMAEQEAQKSQISNLESRLNSLDP